MNNLKTKLNMVAGHMPGMFILNYFKNKTGLPDLKCSLSSSIAPTAIATASEEVKALWKLNGTVGLSSPTWQNKLQKKE